MPDPDDPTEPEHLAKVLTVIEGEGRVTEYLNESRESPGPGMYPVHSQPRWIADPHSMRGVIALILVSVSGAVVLGSIAIAAFQPGSVEGLVRVLGLILSFLGGLVGAATGFYYGRTSGGR